MIRSYGYAPSVLDGKELKYGASSVQLPDEYELSDLPSVINQGSSPICVSAVVSDMVNWKLNYRQGKKELSPYKIYEIGETEDNGMNPIRALVYSIPTILAVIGSRYIKQENDSVINFAVNASMISTGLSIVAVGTSGIFIGRLPIYVSMYAMSVLLPWEIKHIFTAQSARLIKIIAVICFVAFFE